MQTQLDKLTEFLNIPFELLANQSADIISKLIKAVNDDDYMAIHHLGYNLKLEEG